MTDYQKSAIKQLRESGVGYGKIAAELKLSLNTVKSFCRRNDVAVKKNNKTITISDEKTLCDNCGAVVVQIFGRKKKRFCCDKCRNAWWNSHLENVDRKAVYSFVCPVCGDVYSAYGNAKRKYCSRICAAEARKAGTMV